MNSALSGRYTGDPDEPFQSVEGPAEIVAGVVLFPFRLAAGLLRGLSVGVRALFRADQEAQPNRSVTLPVVCQSGLGVQF